MTINNINTFINALLIAVLAIVISSVVSDNEVFNTVVETEEIEEVGCSLEASFYQSKLLSVGSGGDSGDSLFLGLKLKEPFYFFSPIVAKTKLSKRRGNLDSIPLFIKYCSLKVYS